MCFPDEVLPDEEKEKEEKKNISDGDQPADEKLTDDQADSPKPDQEEFTVGPAFAGEVDFGHPDEDTDQQSEEKPADAEAPMEPVAPPAEDQPEIQEDRKDEPAEEEPQEQPADQPGPVGQPERELPAWRRFLRRRGLDICCAALFFALTGGILYTFVGWLQNAVVYGKEVAMEAQEQTCAAENPIFAEYVPHVNVTVNEGKANTMVNTPVVTVGEVLAQLGIYLDDNDQVEPALDVMIEDNLLIVVSKIDEVEIVMDEVIQFSEQIDYIQTIPIGQRKIAQTGSDGLSRRVLRQVYSNGVLESETIVSEEIVTKPVTQIVKVGAGGTFTAPDGTKHRFNYYVDVEATAYGGEMFSGLTYTGKQIELGDIAVDPEVIPLGSKVYVMGDEHDGRFEDIGVCSAQDTGRLIVGEKIDIYMGDDLELCRLFGRRPMRVYVMEIGTWERFG